MTNPIIFEFVAGVIIGKIYLSPFEIWSRFYANLLVFLTVALVVWQYASHFRLGHGLSGFGFSLVPAFLVLCIASKTLDLSVPKPAVYLGEISYSLYLFHPLVQEGADRYLIRLGFGNLLSGPAPIFATTVLSIAVAGLSYRYIERGLSERMRLSLMRTIHRQTPGSGQFGGGEAAHDDG